MNKNWQAAGGRKQLLRNSVICFLEVDKARVNVFGILQRFFKIYCRAVVHSRFCLWTLFLFNRSDGSLSDADTS